MKWRCPECGKETEGTPSEGGVVFALCEECYKKIYGKEE